MASWSDKETTTCEVKLTLDGEEVKVGTSLTDEGSLTLTVTDGSGESKSPEVEPEVEFVGVNVGTPSDILHVPIVALPRDASVYSIF